MMAYATLWQESLDAAGREAYVAKLLPMAYQLAGKYAKRWSLDYDDMVSAALLGLANAAARFDPSLGFAPTTYAHYAIERAIWAEMYKIRGKGLGRASGKCKYRVPDVEWIGEVREADLYTEDASNDDAEYLARMLERLTRRQRAMVKARYIDGLTLNECSRRFGVTKERCRQIINRAIDVMRKECV